MSLVPSTRRRPKLFWVAVWALVIVSVGYAPIAMTAIWPFADPGAPALGVDALANATSYDYVNDAIVERTPVYDKNIAALLVHTIGGGLLMVLGPIQLLSAVRRRRRLHRSVGVLYAVTVFASMIGALIYLATTPMDDVFSGPVFALTLTTILIGTVMSVTFALLSLAQGLVHMHFRWMALNYAFLMTAPGLRGEWYLMKKIHPEVSLDQANVIAVMHHGGLVVVAALVASRMLDTRRTAPGVTGTWLPWPAFLGGAFFSLVALVPMAIAFHSWGGDGDRLFLWFLVPYLVAAAIMTACIVRARAVGKELAQEEWRIHLFLLCGVPGLALSLGFAFDNWLGVESATALTGALAVSWGVCAFGAFWLMGLRLWFGKRAAQQERTRRHTALAEASPSTPELVDAR